MKLLVVDVGNTSTAAGLWTDGRVSNVVHVDGKVEGLEDLGVGEWGMGNGGGLDGLAYVSVVPERDAKWRKSAKRHGLRFHQLTYRDLPRRSTSKGVAKSATPPLVIYYPRPETIGADRLADAAGAVSRYGAPVLVMDFGTALTAAIVTSDRVWRGGVIAPGFPLMRDYLFERTAKLPRMELGRGQAPKIGRSTEEAMRFGAIVGYRGMVREIVATLRKNFCEDFRLVATGGFARWALKDLDLPFVVDPTLTLYGTGLVCATAGFGLPPTALTRRRGGMGGHSA